MFFSISKLHIINPSRPDAGYVTTDPYNTVVKVNP